MFHRVNKVGIKCFSAHCLLAEYSLPFFGLVEAEVVVLHDETMRDTVNEKGRRRRITNVHGAVPKLTALSYVGTVLILRVAFWCLWLLIMNLGILQHNTSRRWTIRTIQPNDKLQGSTNAA